jgi:hypothetical protein
MVAPTESQASQTPEPRPVSPRKRRANRRNAQQSTGPRTPEGKAVSSRNATTHGIFCRDVVLRGEDPHLFEVTRDGFLDALRPQDAAQLALVVTAVSARWRMNRCQHAEARLIEQRIAMAGARVNDKFESLKRNMRFEDFSSAALDAQCAESELFRRRYQKWKSLRAVRDQVLHPGRALAALMEEPADDQPLERLSRYENRLEQSFHRCLRDLHVLKQRAKEYADEPPSPFRTQYGVASDEDYCAERGLGVPPPERSSAATEQSENEDLGPDAQATEETNETAPVQNEPTAEHSAASVGPPTTSNSTENIVPDPAEMAELRKITERMSRCRPDDDEYDP